MYADKDLKGYVSIMGMDNNEVYVLTEALVRYATNPNITDNNRELAKRIACEIGNINNKESNHGKTSV